MRLGAFLGSFDLRAAAAVCDADLDGLTSLLEQSLLERTADGRLFYLETIRKYALKRLEQSPDADRTRTQHPRYHGAGADEICLSAGEWGKESGRWRRLKPNNCGCLSSYGRQARSQ